MTIHLPGCDAIAPTPRRPPRRFLPWFHYPKLREFCDSLFHERVLRPERALVDRERAPHERLGRVEPPARLRSRARRGPLLALHNSINFFVEAPL